MIEHTEYIKATQIVSQYEREQLNKPIVNFSSPLPIEKVNYGEYVQMNDRFESVHIWSKEKEELNAGRWIPLKITKEIYEQEKAKGY